MFEKLSSDNKDIWSTEHSDWRYRVYLGVNSRSAALDSIHSKFKSRDDARKMGKDFYWRNMSDGYLYLKGFTEEEIIQLYAELFL